MFSVIFCSVKFLLFLQITERICQLCKLSKIQCLSSDILRQSCRLNTLLYLLFGIIQFLRILQTVGKCLSSLVKRCPNKPEHQFLILNLHWHFFVSGKLYDCTSYLWPWHKTVRWHIGYNLRICIILAQPETVLHNLWNQVLSAFCLLLPSEPLL